MPRALTGQAVDFHTPYVAPGYVDTATTPVSLLFTSSDCDGLPSPPLLSGRGVVSRSAGESLTLTSPWAADPPPRPDRGPATYRATADDDET